MNRKVVILVIAHKPTLEWYEAIGLEQCFKILARHPIRLVCPSGLDISAYRRIEPTLEVDFIPSHWLASYRASNRVKILPFLYRRYAGFEYILFHELDAFVFRDELLNWCEQGWDYIGAPWFEGYNTARPDATPVGVGNGGLSLRRTQTTLRVARCWKTIRPATEVFTEWMRCWNLNPRSLCLLFANLTWRNSFHHAVNRFLKNLPPEDVFWSCAGRRIQGFRLAPYEEARRFSFEVNPERLFLECGNKLPFGCHKWMEYQPDFWKPLIEAEGYRWLAAPTQAAKVPFRTFA